MTIYLVYFNFLYARKLPIDARPVTRINTGSNLVNAATVLSPKLSTNKASFSSFLLHERLPKTTSTFCKFGNSASWPTLSRRTLSGRVNMATTLPWFISFSIDVYKDIFTSIKYIVIKENLSKCFFYVTLRNSNDPFTGSVNRLNASLPSCKHVRIRMNLALVNSEPIEPFSFGLVVSWATAGRLLFMWGNGGCLR